MKKINKILLLITLIGIITLVTISSALANEITINQTNSNDIKGAIENGNRTINLEG